MSFRRNILASYASQIYVTLVGIFILPLYLRYMGAEAYGLVGLFTMLQAWFNLLDMGLTPTVARETARFRGGATDALSYRRLLRALQLFLAVALLGGGAMFVCSGFIAEGWLKRAGASAGAGATSAAAHVDLCGTTLDVGLVPGLYFGLRAARVGAGRLRFVCGHAALCGRAARTDMGRALTGGFL